MITFARLRREQVPHLFERALVFLQKRPGSVQICIPVQLRRGSLRRIFGTRDHQRRLFIFARQRQGLGDVEYDVPTLRLVLEMGMDEVILGRLHRLGMASVLVFQLTPCSGRHPDLIELIKCQFRVGDLVLARQFANTARRLGPGQARTQGRQSPKQAHLLRFRVEPPQNSPASSRGIASEFPVRHTKFVGKAHSPNEEPALFRHGFEGHPASMDVLSGGTAIRHLPVDLYLSQPAATIPHPPGVHSHLRAARLNLLTYWAKDKYSRAGSVSSQLVNVAAPGPADPKLAGSCIRLRRISAILYSIALSSFILGVTFAFVLPPVGP